MSLKIAIEGLAGVGKSTACMTVSKALDSKCVLIDEFPKGFINGHMNWQSINAPSFSFSDHFSTPLTQTFMMAANAAFKMECGISSGKEIDKVVVYDRYIESVIAYQGAVLKSEGHSNKIVDLFQLCVREAFIAPDLTFYISLPLQKIRERLEQRGLKLNDSYYSFLNLVSEEYEHNLNGNAKVIIIDGHQSQEEVAKNIIHKIKEISL